MGSGRKIISQSEIISQQGRENIGVQIIQMINELSRNGMMKGTFRAEGARVLP